MSESVREDAEPSMADGASCDGAAFVCPRCGGTEHDYNGPGAFSMWLWRLNPALAINDVCGQRLAGTFYVCKSCDLPSAERAYIPCPNCQGLQPATHCTSWIWVLCPECDQPIPCTRNWWGRLFLLLTLPLWYLPAKALRPKVMAWRLRRRREALQRGRIERNWTRRGIMAGLMWFVFTALFASIGLGFSEDLLIALALLVPASVVFGAVLAVMLRFALERRPKERVQIRLRHVVITIVAANVLLFGSIGLYRLADGYVNGRREAELAEAEKDLGALTDPKMRAEQMKVLAKMYVHQKVSRDRVLEHLGPPKPQKVPNNQAQSQASWQVGGTRITIVFDSQDRATFFHVWNHQPLPRGRFHAHD